MKTIPFAKPYLGREEKRAVCRVIDSGNIGQGEVVEQFEMAFANYVGSKYAISVSSCTSALFLALKAIGVKEHQNVIVSPLTFTSSASTIRHCGALPVFCDVDMETMCLDQSKFEILKIMSKPVAYVDVQLTGNETPWEDISIPRVIDSAHLIERGCHKPDQLRCYSFHPTKNMTTGFGGMISTDDPTIAKWCKLARLHGCWKREWEKGLAATTVMWGYDVNFCGWKMNMTNIQAAIGIEQLKKLDWMNKQRLRCVSRYNRLLNQRRIGLHLYPIFVRDRNDFVKYMKENGVDCSVHFEPLHLMKAYEDVPLRTTPYNAEWIGQHVVSLPLFPTLKDKEIDHICKTILKSNLFISP